MSRTLRSVLAFLLAACFCPGCHSYMTQRYLVVDADTGRPIPGATISVRPANPFGLLPFPPRGSSATGGADGVVSVRVPERWKVLAIDVRAEGYGETDFMPRNVQAPPDVEVWALKKLRPPPSSQHAVEPGQR